MNNTGKGCYTDSMRAKPAFHAAMLITAVIVTFFWVIDESLSYFSLQLSALLLLTLIFTHRILKPVSFKLVESTISTFAVLLIVSATGGISSPLFFLNYFLLFELSLLLEPMIPFLLSLAVGGYYLLLSGSSTTPFNLLELLAFPVMTPLAIYFGKLYERQENQKKEIKNLHQKIDALEEELVEEETK